LANPAKPDPATSEAIRIAALNFVHETVTFLPNDTTLDDFVHDGSPARGEALLAWEPRSYMGGFVKVTREHAGVELVGIESPLWPRTGTGSGWITREAYEHFLGTVRLEALPYRNVDISKFYPYGDVSFP
jgi:microcystin degradation protein MlrC